MGADDDVEGYSPNRTVTGKRVLEGSTTLSAGDTTVCRSLATLTIAFEMERGDFSLDYSVGLSDGWWFHGLPATCRQNHNAPCVSEVTAPDAH